MAGFDEQLTVFEANTKVEDRIHVIKVINYSFKCILFFTPPSTSSNHWRCVQKPWGDFIWECCEFKCDGWHEHGEPTCNQYKCSEVKPLQWGKAMMYAGAGCIMWSWIGFQDQANAIKTFSSKGNIKCYEILKISPNCAALAYENAQSCLSFNLLQKMFEPILIYVKIANLCQYFAMIPKDISRDSPKHMLMWHHSVTNPLKDKLLKTHFQK